MNAPTDWLSRKDWQNGQIRPRHLRASFYSTVGFFLVWTGAWLIVHAIQWQPLLTAMQRFIISGYEKFDPLVLLPLGLLVSLLQLPHLVKTLRRYLLARHVRLNLDPFPGAVGGQVGGDLVLPLAYQSHMSVDVRVNCVRVSSGKSSGGQSKSRWEHVSWRGRAAVETQPVMNGTLVRFVTEVPDDLPPSSVEQTGSHVYWAVRVQLPDKGFDEVFNVPVFTGQGKRQSGIRLAEDQTQTNELPANVVTIDQAIRSTVVRFAAGRSGIIGKVLLLMGLIFSGVAVFMAYLVMQELVSARPSYFAMLVEGMIFLGFSLFGLGMMLGGLFEIFNRLRVELRPEAIIRTQSFMGKDFVTRIERTEVRQLEQKVTQQSGQGASANIQYSIYLHLLDGRKVSIASGVPGHETSDQLYAFFQEHIGTPAADQPAPGKQPMPAWAKSLVVGLKLFSSLAVLATIAAFIMDFMTH